MVSKFVGASIEGAGFAVQWDMEEDWLDLMSSGGPVCQPTPQLEEGNSRYANFPLGFSIGHVPDEFETLLPTAYLGYGYFAARNSRAWFALFGPYLKSEVGPVDSFESPRGTDYQVPAGATTYIVQLEGVPATSTQDVSIQIGYGDTAVANATSAPDAAVIVYAITVDDGLLPAPREVLIPIPAGKYPFMLMDAAGNLCPSGLASGLSHRM